MNKNEYLALIKDRMGERRYIHSVNVAKSAVQLAEKYGFKVGANISYSLAGDGKYLNLMKEDFNTITASNEFKAYSLLKQSACQAQNKPVNAKEKHVWSTGNQSI